MPRKKKAVKKTKPKRAARPSPARSRTPAPTPASLPAFETQPAEVASSAQSIAVPMQEFKFGGGTSLFASERPIAGADIDRMKNETGYDLNTLEASLGISRRTFYYELIKQGAGEPLPDISMAILMRLYEQFPRQLLPFQPISWGAYLTKIGVQPGEFAQLVGRAYNAGRTWEQDGKPSRTVQLILEAFVRAGVTSTQHPVYQAFLQIAKREAILRGKPLEIWTPQKRRRRRTRTLVQAEASLMTPVED